jgi:hypothetical protein
LARAAGARRLDLAVDRGRLECSIVEIDGVGGAGGAEVVLGSRALHVGLQGGDEFTRLTLSEPVTIASGETFSAVMR